MPQGPDDARPRPLAGNADDDRRARHYARLVFLSYRYSQGGIGTQNRMLRFVEERFHPDLMRGPLSDKVRDLAHAAVSAVFLKETAHPATAVPWEHPKPEAFRKTSELVTNELADLFRRFTDPSYMTLFSSDPPAVAESVLVMDADYLQRVEGRASSSEPLLVRVGAYAHDPWDSVFVRHAVLRRTTRTREFDDLFGRLCTPDVLHHLDRHGVQVLHFVLNCYRDRHPANCDRRLHDLTVAVREL